MRFLIIIPTLNEHKNIGIIKKKIIKIFKNANILFIDDNSTDGSKKEIINLSKIDKRINYIFRPKKLGIGSAHKLGLKLAKKKNYRYVCTMDCDGTHNPIAIKTMFKLIKNYDLVMTTRFKNKKMYQTWPIKRIFITHMRYNLVRLLLGTKLDSSGGFRLYDLKKIKLEDIFLAKDNNYNFLWESTFLLENKKYKLTEIPINLPFRTLGISKMRTQDIISGIFKLLKTFVIYRL
jgi:dolichol-phosphate mannosyltransferase|tara:strand:- start:3100 stop:3801 length:702 start_codon:yes stop_codon:yes gene_type:complete